MFVLELNLSLPAQYKLCLEYRDKAPQKFSEDHKRYQELKETTRKLSVDNKLQSEELKKTTDTQQHARVCHVNQVTCKREQTL